MKNHVDTLFEQTAVTSGRGRWSDRHFPKRGWQCFAVQDLGAPRQRCEMCEATAIRYVHLLSHPDRDGDVLAAGCVCAGYLQGDLSSAQQRDQVMRSRAGKRQRWVMRRWKVSAKGNYWLTVDGYTTTVYPTAHRHGWGAVVSGGCEATARHIAPQATRQAAMLAAFDLVTMALTQVNTVSRVSK